MTYGLLNIGASPDWQPIKLGNGGVISRLSFASDGTHVYGTDTGGAYIWNGTSAEQLLDSTRMPALDVSSNPIDNQIDLTQNGVEDIVVEYGNSSNVWMLWQGDLYKSTNKGVTFSTTGFPTQRDIAQRGQSNASPVKIWGPYIAIDPANSSVVYVSTDARGLWVTTNGGTTFSPVTQVSAGLPPNNANVQGSPSIGTDTTTLTPGTSTKIFSNNTINMSSGWIGGRIQVWSASAPSNQMIGTVTAVGATTFTLNVTNAQGSTSKNDWSVGSLNQFSGGHRVCFDPSSLTTGGKTQGIYVHTYNVGTWHSTDAGSTWTNISSGAPIGFRQMACHSSGKLWVIDDDYVFNVGLGESNSNVNSYNGTTWTTAIVTMRDGPSNAGHPVTVQGIAINGNQIAVGASDIAYSNDAGVTWSHNGDSTHRSWASSGDVTWALDHFNANPTTLFFSGAAFAFDPLNVGRVYFGAEGLWYSDLSTGTGVLSATYNQQSRGIEEFIGIRVVSANADAVVVTCWDFPGFYKTTSTFNSYPLAVTLPPAHGGTSLTRGYSVDWQWSNRSKMAAIIMDGNANSNSSALNFTGFSLDGGQTWTTFPTVLTDSAASAAGGDIAISTKSNGDDIVFWVQNASGAVPKFSTSADNGVTWSAWAPIVIPGGTPTNNWGWLNAGLTNAKTMDSDKANGDVYIYNVNANNGGSDQIYKWTRSTGLWSNPMHPNFPNANFSEILKSVGVAGHIFFSPGIQGVATHPGTTSWYYTTDGFASVLSTVGGFEEVQAFGYGKNGPGGYPTLFAAGWYNGVYGIWMCKDFVTGTGLGTWTKLGTYPKNLLFNVTDLDGDKFSNRVYINTNGGAFWREFT